ncbi:phenylacetate-CoA oxygenase subunit PaaI [Kitasatospora herbaricolor]|uniref:1,2-phenylacetyl-CoA epoxidase subunit PaaC n=1 Tax=Kitasatospora herbaricolor TaxID=68217 RepID=UPI0019C4329A|nr:1,2-phenylacetyl-CoA epoxidase subunit PaaC [Kitasatospora herbaricolor]MDQ0311620.1 ring-1,2-phenylacetyl-CoA epoxidase subunit PaaC [Kitasatospora herbaricolor]GGU95564.1 phenylacetate-CoA oxygenase subunit PaaI [Kitasatospora herbaricolor]
MTDHHVMPGHHGAGDDHVYLTLSEAGPELDGEARWAYGTGFSDPLLGVDTTVPEGLDGADLAAYCLMLGDDALVLAQRLTEWCTRAPELEEEVALANLGLDLLGQARLLLTRAGQADGTGRGEDELAYWREEHEFRNVRLVEAPNGDFAHSVARLLLFATARKALYELLAGHPDPVLAAVAARGVLELAYHQEYATAWTLRLGDGTPYSAARMQAGLDAVWPLLDELFTPHPVELRIGADPSALREPVLRTLAAVLAEAGLTVPEARPLAFVGGRAGRDGVHTEALGPLLAEFQVVARAHPGATW